MHEAAALRPDPVQDAGLAVMPLKARFLPPPVQKTKGYIGSVAVDMDHPGIGENVEPQWKRESISRILPAPGSMQAFEPPEAKEIPPAEESFGARRSQQSLRDVCRCDFSDRGIFQKVSNGCRIVPSGSGLMEQPVVDPLE